MPDEGLRIAVVGAGALGTVFGVLYARAGHRVVLVEKDTRRLEELRSGAPVVFPDGTVQPVRAQAWGYPLPERPGAFDLVQVSVKGYDTEGAARDARPLVGPQTVVLSVQNGLGNLEVLAGAFGAGRTVGGITAHSAQRLSDGRVRYAGGRGPLLAVGPAAKEPLPPVGRVLRALRASLEPFGLAVEIVDDIEPVRWKKLIANVSTNPLAAISGLPADRMLANPALCRLIDLLAEEAAAVARARGLSFPELTDPGGFCRWALSGVGPNKISMLQDVEARRPTEIGCLNEALAAEGERLGVACPTHRTVALLVRAIEAGYRR